MTNLDGTCSFFFLKRVFRIAAGGFLAACTDDGKHVFELHLRTDVCIAPPNHLLEGSTYLNQAPLILRCTQTSKTIRRHTSKQNKRKQMLT